MMSRYVLAAACVVAILIGQYFGREAAPPAPPDRPVLRLLIKAARLGLWLVMLAEPEQPQPRYHAVDEGHIDHMRSL
jgi:hypothetical protein